MSNDLTLPDINSALINQQKPEYHLMLQNINEKMPAVIRDTSNFHKAHSQFMQVTLDITAITPLRSVYHTLAEVEQTRRALEEAYINQRKQQINLKRKEHELTQTEDPFDREMIEVEIMEINTNMSNAQNLINGALRKLNHLVNQHDLLLKKIGKTEITEEDYEREEARYHIMTCMKQGLNAARARGGLIDEGNLIYLFDLGISAAQAQAEVFAYLDLEHKMLEAGRAPTHEMTVKWLEACADKWQNDPSMFANSRGFSTLDRTSLTNVPQSKDKHEQKTNKSI